MSCPWKRILFELIWRSSRSHRCRFGARATRDETENIRQNTASKMEGYRGLEPFWSWNLIPYMTTKNLACSYRFLMNIPSSLWFRISEDVSTGIQDILSKLFQIQRCMKTSRIQCGKGLVHLLFVHVTSIFSLPRIRLVTMKLVVALRDRACIY